MSENSELMINPATRIPLTATGYVQPVAEDYAALKGYTSFTGLDFSSPRDSLLSLAVFDRGMWVRTSGNGGRAE